MFSLHFTAGTHDLNLAMITFHSLLVMQKRSADSTTTANKNNKRNKPIFSVKVPRYDKAMRQGRGDRADEKDWLLVDGESLQNLKTMCSIFCSKLK